MRFDNTINLGHLLTFAGFIASGFAAYSTLDKRITVQEMRTPVIEQRLQENEARTRELLGDIKADMKDVRRSVDDLARTMSTAKGGRT
jgi:uncharacterized protein involved in tellurium resistance